MLFEGARFGRVLLASGSPRLFSLQKLMRGEFNLFMSPFRRPVMAGDDPRSMQAPEVAVDECVSRLRLFRRAFGKPQMPLAVIVP